MIRWGEPGLTEWIGAGYLGLLSVLWTALAVSAGRWGARWRLEPLRETQDLPSITVCIPARDEEANIGPCVRAVLASGYRALELILVDDGSTDATAERAQEAAAGDPRFHLIRGIKRPAGWAGKPWAVSQAAANAAHDRLLFLDADVIIHPDAIGSSLARMERDGLDVLSLFGTWTLESFWEKVAIPPVGWLVRGAVDLDAVNDPARAPAFANGQYIMVRRGAYEDLGGHASVRAEVLEDVHLAQVFKQRMKRLGLFYAPWAFRVRLYRSLREIVSGYTKNFYEGMGRSALTALGLVLFIFVGTLSPFLILGVDLALRLTMGWTLLDPLWLAWVAAICGLVFLFRYRLERSEGRGGVHALTHPLGNLILVWIALRSMGSLDVEWKGRRFRDGKAVDGG